MSAPGRCRMVRAEIPLLILPLTAIVSLFLYHAIEEPGIRLGRSTANGCAIRSEEGI